MPITFDEVDVEVADRAPARDGAPAPSSAPAAVDPREQLEALLRLHAERAQRVAAD